MVEQVGNLEAFLRKARPQEIDIVGIAMYSLFEPNELYDTILKLADENYTIRLILADPKSSELALQEQIENKPGVLQNHIEYMVNAFRKRVVNYPNCAQICKNLKIGYSKLLPKVFILRTGHRMITSTYFGRGPYSSPTMLLHDVPDGLFEDYKEYVDDIMEKMFVPVSLEPSNPPD